MTKTKLVIKGNQILVDAELIFEEIKKAKGDWKRVEKEMQQMLQAFSDK